MREWQMRLIMQVQGKQARGVSALGCGGLGWGNWWGTGGGVSRRLGSHERETLIPYEEVAKM